MNDNELDDLLNTWHAPPIPASMRERARNAFATTPRESFFSRFRRWVAIHPGSLAAGAAIAAAAALLMIVSPAGSQPIPSVPWTVDSEFLQYADDGSSSVQMLMTSYVANGNETVSSRSAPSNLFRTAMWQAADALGAAHNRIIPRLMFDQAKLEKIQKAREARAAHTVGAVTGCGPLCLAVDHFYFERSVPGLASGCITGEIIGRETILGHATAAFRSRWTERGRMTVWMAPDLGCFALRSVYEAEQPDGSFKVVAEKRAVGVNVREQASFIH
jgi:hypothetical protein